MSQHVRSVDDTRRMLIGHVCRIVRQCHTDCPAEIALMLWGAGEMESLDDHDRRLARRQRRILDESIVAGYFGDAADQLEGLCSAAGLDDGYVDRDALSWG